MTRRAKSTPAIETRITDREEEEAYFRTMEARMPDKSRLAIEKLRLVKEVYVSCDRDKSLRVGFDRFWERYLAGRNLLREEADIYFLVGASGAGKTKAVGRLLREHPAMQAQHRSYGTVTPYVSIKLKGYALPRLVAGQIMQAAGYGRVDAGHQGEMWDGLNEALRGQLVSLVHIDEAQHLLRKDATKKEKDKLADAIKGASIDPGWPVSFVLSGLPEIMQIPQDDEQVERRGDFTLFTDVVIPDEEDIVERIVREMAEPIGIDVSGLFEGDLVKRLAHAGRYRFARICQLVLSALHEAIHQGRNTLTIANFARAYDRRSTSFGQAEMNPFTAIDWSDLEPGAFLAVPEIDGQEP